MEIPQRLRNLLPVLVLGTLVVAIWAYLVFSWPVSFWGSYDEYAYLALADGANFEIWLQTGQRFDDSGLSTHPGVPFYFASWACLKLAALSAWQADAVTYSYENPERFFLVTRIAALLISLGGIALSWKAMNFLSAWKRAFVMALFFVANPWSVIYGCTILAVETFAFPLAAIMFQALRNLRNSDVNLLRPWIILGAVTALGYLVKLTYIFMLFGAFIAVVCIAFEQLVLAGDRMRFIVSRTSIVAGTNFAICAIVLIPLEGLRGFFGLMQVHAGFLFHTRGGDGSSLSASAMSSTLKYLQMMPGILFLTVFGVLACIFMLLRHPSNYRIWNWVALGMLAFTALAILNHFQVYYLPAVAALLPFAFAPFFTTKRTMWAVTAIIAIAAPVTAHGAIKTYKSMYQQSAAIASDEKKILSLPLKQGEARLWTYRAPSKYFAQEFSLQLAGLQDFYHRAHPLGSDVSSYARIDRPYRYIVMEKRYHPTIEGIKDLARKNQLTEPNGLIVRISPEATYRVFDTTILIEN